MAPAIPVRIPDALAYATGFLPDQLAARTLVDGVPGIDTVSKALAIRNPKTGEVVCGGSCGQPAAPTVAVSSLRRARWEAVAKEVAKGLRTQRWHADHSTFSALNVDGLSGSSFSSTFTESRTRRVRQEPNTMKQPAKAATLSPLSLFPESRGQLNRAAEKVRAAEHSKETLVAHPAEPQPDPSPDSEPQQGSPTTPTPTPITTVLAAAGGAPVAEALEEERPTNRGEEVADAADVTAAKPEANEDATSKADTPARVDSEAGVAASRAEGSFKWLLDFRAVTLEMQPPEEIRGLVASAVQGEVAQVAGQASSRTQSKIKAGASRSPSQGLRGRACSSGDAAATSPQAYQAFQAKSGVLPKMQELRRTVQSLLNKVCPENVATIAEKIIEVKVTSHEELQSAIGLIFKKAISEPHYCETYADLVFRLQKAFPEFPSPDGGKPLTFKAVLLNICQEEFESLPTSLDPSEEDVERYDAEELEFRQTNRKKQVLGNMKLLGMLFLRQLVSARVIGSVLRELALCDDESRVPEEHVIECAVELLMSIGHTLESMPAGKQALIQVIGRLMDLKQRKGRDGRGVYCKRIQFAIQDLVDARNAGWVRKVFGGVAKTKEEIRRQQERDLSAQAAGKEVGGGQLIVSGQRPQYISAARKEEETSAGPV